MAERFSVPIKVRHYELDTVGHLNHAVYHSYGEVARLELFEKAGSIKGGLEQARLFPVLLESNIKFLRELRAGDSVRVTCEVKFGEGKVFEMNSNIVKADGVISAEITCTLGLMDRELRKLVADPRGRLEKAGLDIAVFDAA
jgi:acyl-CoA thioester hydrolase